MVGNFFSCTMCQYEGPSGEGNAYCKTCVGVTEQHYIGNDLGPWNAMFEHSTNFGLSCIDEVENPTPDFIRIMHKAIWNWLAEDPYREKCEWPGFNRYHMGVHGNCFFCLWRTHKTSIKERRNLGCFHCPGNWPESSQHTKTLEPCMGNIYSKWLNSKGLERMDLALQIADLPTNFNR